MKERWVTKFYAYKLAKKIVGTVGGRYVLYVGKI